ncbi:MAG: hypothetical protein QOE09_591 [Ilumatobacteraceae bacterium]|jgi:hypothetical protein
MTTQRRSNSETTDQTNADPIDEEAAQIDARSEDAPAKIEELIEHADKLGRDPSQPIDADADADVDGVEEPEVLPG